ncbi:hypothetical protein ACFX1W_017235 [Malus domestica]
MGVCSCRRSSPRGRLIGGGASGGEATSANETGIPRSTLIGLEIGDWSSEFYFFFLFSRETNRALSFLWLMERRGGGRKHIYGLRESEWWGMRKRRLRRKQ